MIFYDTETRTATSTESDTTIVWDDERVIAFFSPLPSGKKLDFTAEGLPLIVDIPQPTQGELDQIVKNTRIAEIDARLDEIDKKSIRSIRKKNTGRDIQADRDVLLALDNEADTLRDERELLTT